MVHIICYLQTSLEIYLLHICELNLNRLPDSNNSEGLIFRTFFPTAYQLGFSGEVKLNMRERYLQVYKQKTAADSAALINPPV